MMPVSAIVPKVFASIAALIALCIGLSTYTLPMHGGPTYGDVRDLLSRALGDSQPSLPVAPASLALHPVAPPMELNQRRGESAVLAVAPASSQAQAWATEAAGRDPAAVRAWLGDAVLVTAVVEGDTVVTTLRRLTLHRGCPWLTQLRAQSAGVGTGALQIVSLTADCPGAGSP
jgi:hypothetical protein